MSTKLKLKQNQSGLHVNQCIVLDGDWVTANIFINVIEIEMSVCCAQLSTMSCNWRARALHCKMFCAIGQCSVQLAWVNTGSRKRKKRTSVRLVSESPQLGHRLERKRWLKLLHWNYACALHKNPRRLIILSHLSFSLFALQNNHSNDVRKYNYTWKHLSSAKQIFELQMLTPENKYHRLFLPFFHTQRNNPKTTIPLCKFTDRKICYQRLINCSYRNVYC